MEILRTPDDRFEDLPEFPFDAHFHDWEGVRLARVDEGDGPPLLLLHGQPTWSFLFRRSVRTLVDRGYRCIAPDLPGFGRSDKPADVGWYSYERHVDAVASLVDALDLRDVTVVGHDWGGPIGLRLATGPCAERITRIVAIDTFVLTGETEMGDGWFLFRDMVANRPDIEVGRLVRMGCNGRPRELVAAYDAPFPDPAYKAGVKAFPQLIPLSPDAPGAEIGHEIVAALRDDARPVLLLWGERDPMFPRERFAAELHTAFPNAAEPLVVEDSGHFVFEDQGERVATLVADWVDRQRGGG